MPYYVYIIYSESNDKFYIGQTKDFEGRLRRHNSGIEKSTSRYSPWIAKCIIEKESRSQAMLPEKKLKYLNRDRLIKFINKYGEIGPRRGLASLGADL